MGIVVIPKNAAGKGLHICKGGIPDPNRIDSVVNCRGDSQCRLLRDGKITVVRPVGKGPRSVDQCEFKFSISGVWLTGTAKSAGIGEDFGCTKAEARHA